MKTKQIILYFTITVALIYCTPNNTPVISSTDTVVSKASLSAVSITSLNSNVKLTTAMNTQVVALIAADRAAQAKDITNLSNQLVTINLSNADRDKKLTSQSLLITSLQTNLKATQDSLNLYKKWADGSVFKQTNGVLTIPYFLDMKEYLIKIGAIKR